MFHCEGAARKPAYHQSMGSSPPAHRAVQDVRIHHRRADVGMAEEFMACVMFLCMMAVREEHTPPHKIRSLPIANCCGLHGSA